MTIRTRLLSLLLPTFVLFAVLISLFFFANWNREITDSFRSNLKSVVVTTAELLNPDEIAWVNAHREDPALTQKPIYQKLQKHLRDLHAKLSVANLHVVSIEPVKLGERVLLDQPPSETNKVNDGSNPELAFRQVYLLDSQLNTIYQDFSESNEQQVYYTQAPLITPIYHGKSTSEEFMSGYAPIINTQGQVIALVGADVNLDLLHRIVRHAILVLLLSMLALTLLVALVLIFIANKISEPVSQLKNAALTMAAGDYEEKIAVKGPKEISELADTFNTMRECLLDHMNRLRANSFLREKLYGERECAALLQNRMLDEAIERFHDPRLMLKKINSSPPGAIQGLKLSLDSSPHTIRITLTESLEEGFEGLYSLLNGAHQSAGEIMATIDFNTHQTTFQNSSMPIPLLWVTQQASFLPDNSSSCSFSSGDFLFLFNQEVARAFPDRQQLYDWMSMVLRQFATEELDLLIPMLTDELNFWLKKQPSAYPVHILCVKFLA